MHLKLLSSALAVLALSACSDAQQADVHDLADAWLIGFAEHDPLEARLWGVDTRGQPLIALPVEAHEAAWLAQNRAWSAALDQIDANGLSPAERALHANLRNKVDGTLALEVCRRDLWPLNHVAGWHLNLPNSLGVALEEAGTSLTAEQVELWADALLTYLPAERANLEAGLNAGYSTPRSIARQVADQFDALAELDGPLSPAGQGLPHEIESAWLDALGTRIGPAFRDHARYIRDTYAPQARAERSIAALPNGAACYQASLFQQTGLRVSPETLLARADAFEADAEAALVQAGHALWGLNDAEAIRARFTALEAEQLETPEAVIATAQVDADRLLAASAYLFPPLPDQSVRIDTYPADQRAGMTASYRPDFAQGYAGVYTLNPDSPGLRDRRTSESITSHEVAPGHHTQAMVARHAGTGTDTPLHPILTVGINNTFVEGWANYAEILAAEEGLLRYPETEIGLWIESGEVIPIAIGFNTGLVSEADTARAALRRRGTPDAPLTAADNVLDWLAMMPGQILTYDLGAQALLELRDRARSMLGDRFDYPTFHRLILEEGSVPLWRVEEKIDAWIDDR
ncbi:DUF885 domain-containing protein [uncultured Maricaulis sp.]|uniref:DUF885 domain-containing protein n=1 Tax=uncultured Maricaulis sp. TaxID=174710 RepID=UPI00260AD7AD|nr:DUF885 domain-containing protein [uncultured Maricaulis sp.]